MEGGVGFSLFCGSYLPARHCPTPLVGRSVSRRVFFFFLLPPLSLFFFVLPIHPHPVTLSRTCPVCLYNIKNSGFPDGYVLHFSITIRRLYHRAKLTPKAPRFSHFFFNLTLFLFFLSVEFGRDITHKSLRKWPRRELQLEIENQTSSQIFHDFQIGL